ncbi:MAG: hypothetical protein WKF99_09505 [Solirubrobacteraceae bacterium]
MHRRARPARDAGGERLAGDTPGGESETTGSEAALLEALDGFRVKGGKARVLSTAGLRIERFDPSAVSDEGPEAPGDGSLVLGIGLPGLIAIGMFAAVIVLVLRARQ